MDYQYQVVDLGSFSSNSESSMSSDVESNMNKMAQQGWEYVNSITPSVNSQYFGNTHGKILLVFRRKK